jgi:PHD/YefM family antitoxin component YafN of YafNO toxin-antitoxin module
MATHLVRVGMNEFRDELATYIDSSTPVAITRHGHTVGYYIPARGEAREQELLALRQAVEQLATLLAEHGVSEDEVVRELRARRAGT